MLTPWKKSYGQLRQHIKKQGHYFASKIKAMVFPVVMYGCELDHKVESQRNDAFELWCWRRLLRVPWTANRSNQSILGGLMLKLKLQYFWPLDAKTWLIGKGPDTKKDRRQEEKGVTEEEMVGYHHRLDGHGFEKALGVGDGQERLVCMES